MSFMHFEKQKDEYDELTAAREDFKAKLAVKSLKINEFKNAYARIQLIVNDQANQVELWRDYRSEPSITLQRALRNLHAVIESETGLFFFNPQNSTKNE